MWTKDVILELFQWNQRRFEEEIGGAIVLLITAHVPLGFHIIYWKKEIGKKKTIIVNVSWLMKSITGREFIERELWAVICRAVIPFIIDSLLFYKLSFISLGCCLYLCKFIQHLEEFLSIFCLYSNSIITSYL